MVEDTQKGREIETVLLADEEEVDENGVPVSAANEKTSSKKERRAGLVLGVEFSLACALCGAIFLTNVFMPTSAINTFFRSLGREETAKADTRAYSEFAISRVVSEYADTELNLSPTGVLTFTDECCVYPAVEGVLASVTTLSDGRYEVKISHNDDFYSVLSGLDYVYYAEGDEVRSNIPLGYTRGEAEVAVTMFSDDLPITAYTLGENNAQSTGMPLLRREKMTDLVLPVGDVDGNGRLTAYDARLLLQYLTGRVTLTDGQLLRADMNGDGKLDARDASLILRNAT